MPKLCVATCIEDANFHDGGEPTLVDQVKAAGGLSPMKIILKEYPNTTWKLGIVQLKADVETMCSLIEGEIPSPSSSEVYRVGDSGRLRKLG